MMLTAILVGAAGGCATLGFYAQSVDGHLDLMSRRRPITEVIADASTGSDLRGRLETALEIREFATSELALPDGASYRSYADLERAYVVWSVAATPELSLEPRTWCFPVAGCVAYRGYFDEEDARIEARSLAGLGLDVHVRGVRAYSTLGWFADPVLNTMIGDRDYQLAAVEFHELAHQQVYVPGDTSFNEAYAVAVEREGVRRWLRSTGRDDELAAYERALERQARFLDVVLSTRAALVELYASDLDDESKREDKAAALEALRVDLLRLARSWGDDGALDSWTEGELNNAHLALVATYHHLVPAFEALLAERDGDMAAFHEAVDALGRQPPATRTARLEALVDEPDPHV